MHAKEKGLSYIREQQGQPLTVTAIEAIGLTKSYGKSIALDRVHCRIERGEFVIIFGPNGSGKSTLLRIVAGIARPDNGVLHVFGLAPGPSARSHIGAVLHSPMLYGDLSVYENLTLNATLCRIYRAHERIEEVAEELHISGCLHERVRRLSRGMVQRVALARGLLSDPQILVLDEPETGLDVNALHRLESILRQRQNNGKTNVVATHQPNRYQAFETRIITLIEGRLQPPSNRHESTYAV